jgi:hypothetical protein
MTKLVGRGRRNGMRVRTRADGAVPHALLALASILADIARGSTGSDDVAPRAMQAVPGKSDEGGTSAGRSHRGDPSANKEPMP